jgi:hypothetical protein
VARENECDFGGVLCLGKRSNWLIWFFLTGYRFSPNAAI